MGSTHFKFKAWSAALLLVMSLLLGCTVHAPPGESQRSDRGASRITSARLLPTVIPGGSIQTLQFGKVTQNQYTMRNVREAESGLLIVRYSLDGGVSFTNVGELMQTQAEFLWTVPYVDCKTAILQLVLQSKSSTELITGSPVFEIRSNGPVLSQDQLPYFYASNGNSVTYGGTCENQFPITISKIISGVPAQTLGVTSCVKGRWSYSVSSSTDGQIEYQFFALDSVNNSTTLGALWMRDKVPPVLLLTPTSLLVANGAARINDNYVPVSLDAIDDKTNVSHFCLKYSTNPAEVLLPSASCWIDVSDPDQPKLRPSPTLTLRNFRYRLGYGRATYRVMAWVRDAAGNVSNSLEVSTLYDPGIPPEVINVMANKTDPPVLPLAQNELSIVQGTPVTIRWKISSAPNGLGPTPVTLYYTEDDATFIPITGAIANSTNGGCTLASGLSTGCYVWTSDRPTTSYFRVRVAVQDNNGMVATSSTNPLNGNGLSSIAGNTDSGVGASAQAAMFIGPRYGYVLPDSGSFVVTSRGNIFFRDPEKGVLWVQPSDGVVRVLLPQNSSAPNTYEGPLYPTPPTVKHVVKIALDYQNGLLVWDFDRVRRVDLDLLTISTVMGGGSSIADDVDPTQVNMTAIYSYSYIHSWATLVPLPNGDLLFDSDPYNATNNRFRRFSKFSGKVTSTYVSGRGHGPGAEATGYDTEDLATCATLLRGVSIPCQKRFAIGYNPSTSDVTTLHVALSHSVVGNTLYPIANLTPSGPNMGMAVAPHPPTPGFVSISNTRAIGRNGIIYSINRYQGQIARFDAPSNSWVTLVGSNKVGNCPDGTLATQCPIQPSDVFVDAQGNLFFLDRGRIRTVDGTQKIVTIYGQSFYFGDGGLAISARFNKVPSLDQIVGNASDPTRSGEVVLMDVSEPRMRSFVPGGIIQTIAGDGTVQAYPNTTSAASTQPFNVASSGAEQVVFSINPISGDVYTSNSVSAAKLDRSADRWVPITGSLGNIYLPNIIGFDGSNLLMNTNRYDPISGTYADALLRTVALNGTITPFAGTMGNATGLICADGINVDQCELPAAVGNGLAKSTFDSANSRWLILQPSGIKIKSLPTTPAATVSTVALLSQPASSFAYVKNGAGVERVYYCSTGATGGVIIQKEVATGAESPLDWRIHSMACTGYSLIYRPATNTLVFPYIQMGLYGVGEYHLPN